MWLYFVPDCKDVVLEEHAGAATEELKQVYEAQLHEFWSSLPPWVQANLARNESKTANIYTSDTSLINEFNPLEGARVRRGPGRARAPALRVPARAMQPPAELCADTSEVVRNAQAIARMVRCITWSDDRETFRLQEGPAGAKPREIWQSPNFFLELRKGDFEDHALALCNLFLGMEPPLDAYVCVGQLHDSAGENLPRVGAHTDGRRLSADVGDGDGRLHPRPGRWKGAGRASVPGQGGAAGAAIAAAAAARVAAGGDGAKEEKNGKKKFSFSRLRRKSKKEKAKEEEAKKAAEAAAAAETQPEARKPTRRPPPPTRAPACSRPRE